MANFPEFSWKMKKTKENLCCRLELNNHLLACEIYLNDLNHHFELLTDRVQLLGSNRKRATIMNDFSR